MGAQQFFNGIIWWLLTTSSLCNAIPTSRGLHPSHPAARHYRRDDTSPYAPTWVDCPSNPITRSVKNGPVLSEQESSWVSARQTAIVDEWRKYLTGSNITGLDVETAVSLLGGGGGGTAPRVGIAVSGGGYRAMLNAAAHLATLDARNSTLPSAGVLQVSTYLAGLSGGSWLLGSMYNTNFSDWPILQTEIWRLDQSLINPFDGLIDKITGYKDLKDDTNAKEDKGWNTTIVDYWGRLVSIHTTNSSNYGAGQTWSSNALQIGFQNHSIPLPIVTFCQRSTGEVRVTVTANIWESTFFETGSHSPIVSSFIQTPYYGTFLQNNVPALPPQITNSTPTGGVCVNNFDNAGFIIGTSSSLFNKILTSLPDPLSSILSTFTDKIAQSGEDTAILPNPFYQSPWVNTSISDDATVELVDGGESGQNIPLIPLFIPERNLTTIIAVDSSNDWEGWSNGTSITLSYLHANRSNYTFPPIPSTPDEFVSQGLDKRITFFGCGNVQGSISASLESNYTGPLLVYVPNYYISGLSNTSTYKMSYTSDEVAEFFKNAQGVWTTPVHQTSVTQGNDTNSADITGGSNSTAPAQTIPPATCIACAVLNPLFRATNSTAASLAVPETCQQCFAEYCWTHSVRGRIEGAFGPPVLWGWDGTGKGPVIPGGQTGGESDAKDSTGGVGSVRARMWVLGVAWAMLMLLV
ncbi:Lysophospholipase 1 [Rhizophlyctis rosea]|nr:Lysophospholipase 1 [Rhizophlyctis rosea]